MGEMLFFFQAEDGIRDIGVTGVQTCALPISRVLCARSSRRRPFGLFLGANLQGPARDDGRDGTFGSVGGCPAVRPRRRGATPLPHAVGPPLRPTQPSQGNSGLLSTTSI